ncbi:MAG: FAD-binding oxidoreductase [candidate division Zixibacteria bacterium]|nr:FAD-binding oxidoreductase [candidate division Zixibacteria bacterium]
MHKDFIEEIRYKIGDNKVLSDSASLTVYSSDASIYSLRPTAVVQVESESDIIKTIETCAVHNIPITSRAGATGLAGGAVGVGVILDFCRYDKINSIDPQNKIAEVQSGVIYDDLNLWAHKHHLMFPPDPSSGDSCRIGGMLGNNSSGSRTVRYGTTRQYTHAINIITSLGKPVRIEPFELNSKKLLNFFKKNPEYEQVFNLIVENREKILSRRRTVKKNSTGYDLWSFLDKLDEGVIDFTQILVGSEGTLCVFNSAELKLEEIPPECFTTLLLYKNYNDIGKIIPHLLKIEPYSLEVVDSRSMDMIGREKYNLPADASVMLLMQFELSKVDEIAAKLKNVINDDELSVPPVIEIDPVKQQKLWSARKSLLPTLYKHHYKKKPLSFVEDACLPAEKLPEMFQFLDKTFDKHGLIYGSFGHIGDGNIHIKPLVDASDAGDREKMRLVSSEVYNEILRMGGVVSGEHADGRVRAPFLRYVYGEEVYRIFMQIKNILDPGWILNPGIKLVNNTDITLNMDIDRLNWDCSQCGKCVPGCPSYEAYGSELYSPRGRIKIRNFPGIITDDKIESLNTCINCKQCRTICPAGCDASSDSLEFKNDNRRSLMELLFRTLNNSFFLRKASAFASYGSPILKDKQARKLLEQLSKPVLKVDKKSYLPPLTNTPFVSRYHRRYQPDAKTAYFFGCADGILKNETADKIVDVFEMIGIPLDIPEQVCCGVPAESYGFKEFSRKAAEYNIESLSRYDYVITGCGTCVLMLKDYPHLFKKYDRLYSETKKLSEKVFEVTEYLLKFGDRIYSDTQLKVTYHDSCHLRCSGTKDEPRKFIRELGVDFIEMDYADRCCGFAGTYQISNPNESKKIFEIKNKSLIDSGADIVASCCPTCIMQFKYQQDKVKSVHPVSLIDTKAIEDK